MHAFSKKIMERHIVSKNIIREYWYAYRSELLFFLILLACTGLSNRLSVYIPVAFYEDIILPIQHGALTTICFFGAVLLFVHSEGIRVRKAFGYTLLAWGIAESFFIVQNYVLRMPVFLLGAEYMTSYELLAANLLAWLLLVYPTEALRPGWLNFQRAVIQLLPMVALVILDYVVPADLRILIMLYPMVLLVQLLASVRAYRIWCEDNFASMEHIEAQWIVRYLTMVLVIALSYIYICVSKSPVRTFTQNTLLFLVFAYSIEQILFRPDPRMVTKDSEDDVQAGEQQKSEYADYREKLEQWMEEEKPYRNPEFRLMDLRAILPLNRTYLSQLIHSEYDCTFYQFVNSYRVEEAQRLMRENPEMKMADVSAQAGFSSPTYFIRIFTGATGKTPREWRKKIHSA